MCIINPHFLICAYEFTQVYFSKSYLSKFTQNTANPAYLKRPYNHHSLILTYLFCCTYKITAFSQNLCYNLSKQGLRFRLLQSQRSPFWLRVEPQTALRFFIIPIAAVIFIIYKFIKYIIYIEHNIAPLQNDKTLQRFTLFLL